MMVGVNLHIFLSTSIDLQTRLLLQCISIAAENVLVHVSNHCKVAIEEIIIGNNIFVFLFYTLAHSGTFQTLLHEPIYYHYYLFDCKREQSQQSLYLCTCNLLYEYYRRNVIVLKQKLESELFYHQKLVQNVINCISTLKTRNASFCFVLFILDYGTYGFHKIPPCLMSIKNDL